jgi:hypothetical protein
MPPADPSSATTATPIVAMPMSRRWPPLDILDRPLRGFCEASVDRHRFRCAGWKREANSDDGSTAQDSAHHRAAVELIHLARSPNIELPVQCRPAYRERSPRASGPPCVAPSRRRGVARRLQGRGGLSTALFVDGGPPLSPRRERPKFFASGLSRQSNAVHFQGAAIRLPFSILSESILRHTTSCVAGRPWPSASDDPGATPQSVEQAIRLLTKPVRQCRRGSSARRLFPCWTTRNMSRA